MPHLRIIKTQPTDIFTHFTTPTLLSLSLSLSLPFFAKAMKDESWWLKAAISDDRMVAELLLRLKDCISSSAATTIMPPPIPPSWGVRQPRSSVEKKKDTPRRSPTTPLSFGSPSDDSSGNQVAGGGGSQSSDRFRSKVSVTTETPATTSKRPRRKKTFAELKEEEGSLLKERTCLKKELATLRVTLKEQRSMNEKLKRIKLDLGEEPIVKPESNSIEQEEQNSNHNVDSEAGSSSISRQQVKTEFTTNSCPSQQKGLTSQDPIFVLPDLNMTPEEEFGLEGVVGTLS